MAFGDTIQIGDLIRALSRARATATAHVGSGATTTTIPLADLNLAGENLAGNFVLLDAGALGTGSPPTFATIQSNTATSLTVSALSAAPQQGSELWIFAVATIQANIAENIAQWSGTAVAPPLDDQSDSVAAATGGIPRMLARLTAWTGSAWSRLKLAATGSLSTRDDSAGSPGTAAPSSALQVGGTDGTNLRALSVDSFGRLVPQPQALVWDAAGLAVAANTNVFATSYQPPSAGTLTITIGNLSTGANSVASIVKVANSAPSGGSAGTRVFALNSGSVLTAGDIYSFQITVTPNDMYNLQFGTATTVDITATFKPN